MFGLMYVPGKLIDYGSAEATLLNIREHESLFRLGILSNLICQTLFIVLGVKLYSLFRDVDPGLSRLMLVTIIAAVPVAFLNELNHFAMLHLAQAGSGPDLFGSVQRSELIMMPVHLFNDANLLVEILWGLWLLPLGILSYRSNFIPRIIGVLLIIAFFGYLAGWLTGIGIPEFKNKITIFTSATGILGEFSMMLFLLIRGVNQQPVIRRSDKSTI